MILKILPFFFSIVFLFSCNKETVQSRDFTSAICQSFYIRKAVSWDLDISGSAIDSTRLESLYFPISTDVHTMAFDCKLGLDLAVLNIDFDVESNHLLRGTYPTVARFIDSTIMQIEMPDESFLYIDVQDFTNEVIRMNLTDLSGTEPPFYGRKTYLELQAQ